MDTIKVILTPKFRKLHNFPKEGTVIPAGDEKTKQRKDTWWAAENLLTGNSFLDFGRSPMEYLSFQVLHKILTAIGGCQTCFPVYEEDMKKILTRGRFYPGRSRMMKGRPSQCHSNCSELWELNHKDHDVKICTGYALSSDGLWRQHTWLVQRYETATQHRMRIIETTTKRLAYYGFEMTDEEAEEFVYNNL